MKFKDFDVNQDIIRKQGKKIKLYQKGIVIVVEDLKKKRKSWVNLESLLLTNLHHTSISWPFIAEEIEKRVKKLRLRNSITSNNRGTVPFS